MGDQGSATGTENSVYRSQTKLRKGKVFKGDGVDTHPLPGWVCLGVGTYPPPPIHGTWDTAGYGRQTGGTHPTGMLSCFFYL